jgi:hypothetical protein
MKQFPNGFASWQETHYEVVSVIANEVSSDNYAGNRDGLIATTLRDKGHGGLYELAEDLTDEFEVINKDREWDGEFFEELGNFIDKRIKL